MRSQLCLLGPGASTEPPGPGSAPMLPLEDPTPSRGEDRTWASVVQGSLGAPSLSTPKPPWQQELPEEVG